MRRNFTALFALAACLGFGSTTVLAQRGQGHDAKPTKVESHPTTPHQTTGASTHGKPTTTASHVDHPTQPTSTGSRGKSADHVTTARTTTTATTTASGGTTTSTSSGTTSTTTGTGTTSLSRSAQQLQANPKLEARLQTLLGLKTGSETIALADGFRNLGQFVAAAHVSHNMGFSLEDFNTLKGYMTGTTARTSSTSTSSTSPMSLGQAVKKIRNTADVDTQVKTAETQANQDMTTTGTK